MHTPINLLINIHHPFSVNHSQQYAIRTMSEPDEQDYDQHSQYSVANDFNFQSPLPLPKNPALIPTHNEINQSLFQIQSQFPQLQVDKVVSLLYNNLIAPKVPSDASSFHSYKSKKSISNRPSTLKQNDPKNQQGKQRSNQKGQHEQNIRKAQEWDPTSNRQHMFNQNLQPLFGNKEDQVQYQEKKLVARGFCDKGYGLNKLKQHIWQTEQAVLSMNKRRYKVVTTCVINETYRKLEHFLIQDCSRNIKPLTPQQMRALFAILSNSQTKFQQDQYLTFRKFMKVTYDLASVSIFEQSAIKLYIKIQTSLRGRVGTMKLDRQIHNQFKPRKQLLRSPGRFQNQRLESQTIWTSELQADLVDTIAEQRTIARTRDTLKLKYGENVVLNSVKELKGRFFKILRISVKRLMKYAQEYAHKVPLLVTVSDEKIKVIIRSPQAANARIALGKLYKTKTPSAEMLTEVINLVNQFCYLQQTRRQQGEVFKQPAISSVTDKIKHNINISRKMLKNVTTPAQRAGHDANLVFLKNEQANYQHIVSLEHDDKLHYFRKRGSLNAKGGYEYSQKPPQLKKLELDDGDDDSQQMVILSDEDEDEEEEESNSNLQEGQ